MNAQDQRRFLEVEKQLLGFKPEDATPTTDFTIAPEYTLIARLPEHMNEQISALSRALQKRFPEHYYYTPPQYHLTLVPIPTTLTSEAAVALAQPVLAEERMNIHVYGYGVNRFQASAVLYPKGNAVVTLRRKLREAFGIPEQAYTLHRSVWEELLWVNFMRFRIQPSQALLTVLKDHARDEIGRFTLDRYELYRISTKTLDPASSRRLHTFDVTASPALSENPS